MRKKRSGWVTAVFGGQFGDEGKGKIVDYLSQKADIVVRYNGGDNAGHSVSNQFGDFKISTMPTGTVSGVTGQVQVIGNGTVLNIISLTKELQYLEDKGIDLSNIRLYIDKASHLIMPWHIAHDKLEEERRKKHSNIVGTTQRGIGPAYADKYQRVGFRTGDLLNYEDFAWDFTKTYYYKAKLFRGLYETEYAAKGPNVELQELKAALDYLASKFGNLDNLICDTPPILWRAIDKGQNILLEGAQGALLDIDRGTYPYVTSSATGIAGASQGSGIPAADITERIMVVKAYMSRVGNGPFPTRASLYDEEKLREAGQEYGTVTGRPRNCGWFDAISFKYAAQLNKPTGIAVTRLDILDEFIIIGIREREEGIDHAYGWGLEKRVRGLRNWNLLPDRAKDLCNRIVGNYRLKYVSTGPSRDETIVAPKNRK